MLIFAIRTSPTETGPNPKMLRFYVHLKNNLDFQRLSEIEALETFRAQGRELLTHT